MRIRPARRIRGRIRLPGDKSISHRAAIIASMATGASRISNFSTSRDCAATVSCLRALGVSINREGSELQVKGAVPSELRASDEALDCGNSGSTMRMLAGVLAGHNFTSTLTGDGSLRERPMNRIVEPLEMMGARVRSRNGKPPLEIEGTANLNPIRYELPVASAQLKSCLLFAGLRARGRTEVIESLGATRDHTERMLKWFGAPIEVTAVGENGSAKIAIDGPASFSARDVRIPGDISSAAFLIAAAALLPTSDLEIEAVSLNPTRTQFLLTLRSLGVLPEIIEVQEECNEPVATIRVSGKGGAPAEQPRWGASLIPGSAASGKSLSVEGRLIPQLIDELPLLAVVGTQIPGGIQIHNAGELRLKESDRIKVTVKNLRAMGAEVEEFADGLAVAGPTSLRGARIDPFGDHRIAMAFSVAGLIATGDTEIEGEECISVSFPEFFTLLETVIER